MREKNLVLCLVNVVQQHTSPNEQGRTDKFLDVKKSLKKKLLCGSYLPDCQFFATDKPMTTPRLLENIVPFHIIAFDRTEAIILNMLTI